MEGSTLVGAKLGDEGRRAGGEGVLVVDKLANHHYGGRWRAVERPDHDERCQRRVPDLRTYTPQKTGGDGKVEQRESPIGA
jgi:hypothetical protein